MIVATLGVDPHQLFFAASGATLGAGIPSKLGRIRAVSVFAAVVLLSAMFGTAVAELYWPESESAAKASAGLFGLFFHPFVAGIVQGIPDMVKAVIARISGGANSGAGDQQ